MSISKKMCLLVSCATMISMTSFCSQAEENPRKILDPQEQNQILTLQKVSPVRENAQKIKEYAAAYLPYAHNSYGLIGTFLAGGIVNGSKAAKKNVLVLLTGAAIGYTYDTIVDGVEMYAEYVDGTHQTCPENLQDELKKQNKS